MTCPFLTARVILSVHFSLCDCRFPLCLDMCLVIGGLFLLLMVVQLTYFGGLFAGFADDKHFVFVA